MPAALRLSSILLFLGFLTAASNLAGCKDPEPTVDFFSWTNPITGAAVAMPEGWRQSSDTASKGETTVGFFRPNYAIMLGHYGHVTLHYEFLEDPENPMTLERFVGNFSDYMRGQADHLTEPVFSETDGMRTARLSVEIEHRDKQLLLRVRFWTPDNRDYWYAIAESLIDDGDFAERAAPLIERLQQSTRLAP